MLKSQKCVILSPFCKETTNEKKLEETKTWISNSNLKTGKAFKGAVVNQA